MSTTVVVLEIAGITAAAVGMVLAGSPPGDLRAWWDRQEWLQQMVMPAMGEPTGERGLTILPWNDDDDASPDTASDTVSDTASGEDADDAENGARVEAEAVPEVAGSGEKAAEAPLVDAFEAWQPAGTDPAAEPAERWRPSLVTNGWEPGGQPLEGVVLEPGSPSPADHLPPYGTPAPPRPR